jgi:hypothetical protein
MARTKFKGTRWTADEIAQLSRVAADRNLTPAALIRSAVLAELSDRDRVPA